MSDEWWPYIFNVKIRACIQWNTNQSALPLTYQITRTVFSPEVTPIPKQLFKLSPNSIVENCSQKLPPLCAVALYTSQSSSVRRAATGAISCSSNLLAVGDWGVLCTRQTATEVRFGKVDFRFRFDGGGSDLFRIIFLRCWANELPALQLVLVRWVLVFCREANRHRNKIWKNVGKQMEIELEVKEFIERCGKNLSCSGERSKLSAWKVKKQLIGWFGLFFYRKSWSVRKSCNDRNSNRTQMLSPSIKRIIFGGRNSRAWCFKNH